MRVVHRIDRVGVAQIAGGERRPRPLQGAVDGCDGRPEELGDLLGPQPQDFAQDQDRPLARWEVLECGDEREPDALAGDGLFGGIITRDEHAAVRDGLDPGDLGKLRSEGRGGRLRGREVHRAGPALPPVQHVEAHVGGDPVQPRPHRRPTLETIEAAPRPHQRLLDGVVGLERRPQHPVAVAGQPDPILLEVDVGLRTTTPINRLDISHR